MAEPTVQVPVSLVNDAAYSAYQAGADVTGDRLRALLSRPTPSAERKPSGCPCGYHPVDSPNMSGPLPAAAAPPRIEDMAPGTTFVWNTGRWDVARRWTVREEGGARYLVDGDGRQWPASMFNPSTIRDVTPPKEQP